jgi:hypothetical protein
MIVVESEQLLDYIMVRTDYFLMKWWGYLFCTRSTHWVGIYTVVLSHIKSISHIQTTLLHSDMCTIPTPNQPICDLTLYRRRSQCQIYCLWFARVSGWLLFNAKWTIFHLYRGENLVAFDEMLMMSSSYYSSIFVVLAQWNNSPRVDMSLHSDTLSWYGANQSLLLLLSATCIEQWSDIYQCYSLWFDMTRDRIHDLPHWSEDLTITPPRLGFFLIKFVYSTEILGKLLQVIDLLV